MRDAIVHQLRDAVLVYTRYIYNNQPLIKQLAHRSINAQHKSLIIKDATATQPSELKDARTDNTLLTQASNNNINNANTTVDVEYE